MNQYKKDVGKNNFYIILLLHCFFVFSCAQPSTPTGGTRDTTPPVITISNPKNYTTNFTQNEISIKFDEWIQPFTNPQNQVIISPDVVPFPKIEAVRNELNIKFKESLQANTTYSIFFGDNLKDNNEGNIYPNFKIIFSTGNFIDSLKIKGSVKTALEKIPDNTYLLLYKEKEDSAFLKSRPFYISKISADGSFSIENIKNGEYKIYVLSDKNGNYYYDLPTEAIGFTDSFYAVNSNLDTLSLNLFLPEEAILRIYAYDRIVKNGILHLTFNKELSFTKDEITAEIVNNTTIQPIAFQKKDLNLPKETGSEMDIYLPKMKSDTNNLTLIIKHNGKSMDSLIVRTENKNSKFPISFFNDTVSYKSLKVFENNELKITASNYCLTDIETTRIFITDSAKQKIPFIISRSEDLQTYFIKAGWKPGMKYKITFLDSALTDLVGNYNKMQDFSVLGLSRKKAGNLLITYELPQKNHHYIALLKENSGKVLDKQILRDSQTVKINYGLQSAGTFSVELIEDLNKNGIWNSGNFKLKTLPEKIYKESKPIIVKENWDSEENIKVDFDKPAAATLINTDLPIKNNNPVNIDKFNKEFKKGVFGE